MELAQEIEIEFKNLLTKEEFERLLVTLDFPEKSQTQINHYFETKDFRLSKEACALRIREKNGQYQLTLKEPHPEGLLETHDTLTEQEALNWLQGNIIVKEHTKKQLEQLNIQIGNLVYYGSLTTERRQVHYKDVLIVLDYSSYNGHSDYEFELEAPSREIGLQTFNTLLNENSIIIKETPNKIQRFFSTYI